MPSLLIFHRYLYNKQNFSCPLVNKNFIYLFMYYTVLPHGLLETSLQVRQFSQMLSCNVFIFSYNTLYLLVEFFLDARKSCQIIQPPNNRICCLHSTKEKKMN